MLWFPTTESTWLCRYNSLNVAGESCIRARQDRPDPSGWAKNNVVSHWNPNTYNVERSLTNQEFVPATLMAFRAHVRIPLAPGVERVLHEAGDEAVSVLVRHRRKRHRALVMTV